MVSGILIYLLPAAVGADAIWSAMSITEVIVAVYAVYAMAKYTKQLSIPEMDDGGNV